MSRPTKLTLDTQSKIEQAIRMGATYELAAQYGGIAYNTFNEWRKRGLAEIERVDGNARAKIRAEERPFVEFYEAIQKAEGDAAVGWLAKIEKAANDGSWQAAAWKLERRYPENYNRNRTEHTGADGGAVKVEASVKFNPSTMTDEELREFIANESS